MNRGGQTAKTHAVVDVLRNSICLLLTGGQIHESRVACQPLKSIEISQSNIIADKAYGTMKIRNYIEGEARAIPHTPRKIAKNKWACDHHIYYECCLIKSFF
ncbi:transposase [Lactiplantibacillus plantarum]|uniref:transposase n=1 Tax=Lactiplantibacillus plantarum TaxID=1590 RepID=UPI001BA79F75|nr:transposase [Lactiplantibacillus plantarum]